MPTLSQVIHNINHSTYKLNTCGVAGLLGGDNAVNALETIHLYADRRWAGWYNYPGTITVAKKFGQIANSRVWNSIFRGQNKSPAIAFGLAGKSGPEYSGSFSGTKLRTGYLGYLMAAESTNSPSRSLQLSKDSSERRKTEGSESAAVTVVSFPSRQHTRVTSGTKQKYEFVRISPKSRFHPPLALWSIAPSLVSILACVFCFFGKDPLCASLILLGIVSSGFSSLALGTATLKIRVPVPSAASPAGDGLIFLEDGSIIVLKGEEVDVNAVTKGVFELDYSIGTLPQTKFHAIGLSSILLYTQSAVQLLLIPRCSFFGQISFLISFAASGGYHLYVTSHEKENVRWELLSRGLSAQMEKWMLGTRAQAAVFACLVLGDSHQYPLKFNPDTVLSRIIPDGTVVWRCWRAKVVKELERFWARVPSYPYAPCIQAEPTSEDQTEADEYSHLTEEHKGLLDNLIRDARCVFNKYAEWRENESRIWGAGADDAEESSTTSLFSGGSPA